MIHQSPCVNLLMLAANQSVATVGLSKQQQTHQLQPGSQTRRDDVVLTLRLPLNIIAITALSQAKVQSIALLRSV